MIVVVTMTRLQNLREDVLRNDVLIPLLERMGHRGAREHHGGIKEQGKDIVS